MAACRPPHDARFRVRRCDLSRRARCGASRPMPGEASAAHQVRRATVQPLGTARTQFGRPAQPASSRLASGPTIGRQASRLPAVRRRVAEDRCTSLSPSGSSASPPTAINGRLVHVPGSGHGAPDTGVFLLRALAYRLQSPSRLSCRLIDDSVRHGPGGSRAQPRAGNFAFRCPEVRSRTNRGHADAVRLAPGGSTGGNPSARGQLGP
jgi:hypothetical protein